MKAYTQFPNASSGFSREVGSEEIAGWQWHEIHSDESRKSSFESVPWAMRNALKKKADFSL